MAYIRKRKGSWQSIVRVHGYPQMTKTFKTKIDADPDVFKVLKKNMY